MFETMMSSSSSKSAAIAVGVVATTLLLRAMKRKFSPAICCKLRCKCGNIQGQVCAKREDSIRIWCFCDDCREYADFVAAQQRQDNKKGGVCKPIYGEYGESRIVQVCKSDVTIEKGNDFLQLSRKFPPSSDGAKKGKQQIYMHRYYAKCCGVPIFQTVDFLGFVGIFTDNLDGDYDKYDGPVAMFPELALKKMEEPIADIFVPHFLYKLVRYHPYRKMGPFDYDQEPTYWGKSDKKKD